MVIFHGFPCFFVCLPEGNPPSHWFFEVEAPPAAPPQPVLLLSAPEKVLRRRTAPRGAQQGTPGRSWGAGGGPDFFQVNFRHETSGF